MKPCKPRVSETLRDLWKEKKAVMILYTFLRISVILVMLAQLFNRNFDPVCPAYHAGAQTGH